jgi:hypothetical protein
MNKTIIGTCDECKWWAELEDYDGETTCLHTKIGYDLPMYKWNCDCGKSILREDFKDYCSYEDMESYDANIYMGPKFGCIHWEEKK